jgi:hypothetical protein
MFWSKPTGRTAVDRVNARIGNETDLKKIIPNGNLSSCALTAGALAPLASNNKPAAVQNLFPMPQSARVALIDEKLDLGNLVAVSISPDHHFLIVPYENDNVVLLQAFEGVYNFVQWRTACGEMKINRQAFTNAMMRLTSPNKGARLDAAAMLFGFGTIGDHVQTPEGRKVEREVRQYFSRDNSVEINNISYQAI